MWTTVFFGGACKIRTTSQSCRPAPHDLFATRHTRREYLVFKVTVQQFRLFDELDHASCLTYVTGQRLFTGNSDQVAFSGFNHIADCLHVLHTCMIWTAQPYAIDLRSSNHLFNRFENPRIADTK